MCYNMILVSLASLKFSLSRAYECPPHSTPRDIPVQCPTSHNYLYSSYHLTRQNIRVTQLLISTVQHRTVQYVRSAIASRRVAPRAGPPVTRGRALHTHATAIAIATATAAPLPSTPFRTARHHFASLRSRSFDRYRILSCAM